MTNLTEKESAVLKAIDGSEYGDELTDAIWSWSLWDNIDKEVVPNATSIGGIVSSLVKKGLVYVTDEGTEEAAIEMTEAAAELLIEKVGYKELGKWLKKYEDNPETAKY